MSPRSTTRAGAVVLILTGLAGCAFLSQEPVAQFDIDPIIVYAGEAVEFDASTSYSGSPIVGYSWVLGEAGSASGQRVTAAFPQAGIHTVRLTVEDTNGRTDAYEQDVTVYVRSGTQIFYEDFTGGLAALSDWSLDPTWASAGDSTIAYIASDPGYTLYVRSGQERWHRRYTPITLPPLRVGQTIRFSCRVMTLHNQDAHTFLVIPARREIASSAGSLPYYQFTSGGGGSYVREPTLYGTDIGHPVAFKPNVYRWHTYSFLYGADSYEFQVDGVLWQSGPLAEDASDGGEWFILLGEESQTEACKAYYDEIRVSIEE